MAKDQEPNQRFRYTGTHDEPELQPVEKQPEAPPTEFVRIVALGILDGHRGRYRSSGHFLQRMAERNFDLFDITYVIRNGKCAEPGEYCEEFNDHKYVFCGDIDGVDFDAVFALSAAHELVICPLMILITGCWKTATGCRVHRY